MLGDSGHRTRGRVRSGRDWKIHVYWNAAAPKYGLIPRHRAEGIAERAPTRAFRRHSCERNVRATPLSDRPPRRCCRRDPARRRRSNSGGTRARAAARAGPLLPPRRQPRRTHARFLDARRERDVRFAKSVPGRVRPDPEVRFGIDAEADHRAEIHHVCAAEGREHCVVERRAGSNICTLDRQVIEHPVIVPRVEPDGDWERKNVGFPREEYACDLDCLQWVCSPPRASSA